MNIRNFWADSFARFGLDTAKLVLMMRDNASNGVRACKDWGIRHFGCIGHSIHLVVGPFVIEKRMKKAIVCVSQCEDATAGISCT